MEYKLPQPVGRLLEDLRKSHTHSCTQYHALGDASYSHTHKRSNVCKIKISQGMDAFPQGPGKSSLVPHRGTKPFIVQVPSQGTLHSLAKRTRLLRLPGHNLLDNTKDRGKVRMGRRPAKLCKNHRNPKRKKPCALGCL